jgi:protein-S-isoprenylcysteine O-methyltransferase Ste14
VAGDRDRGGDVPELAGALVYLVCGTVGVLYRIRVEERVLLAELGADYRAYAADTARLVPYLW